MPRIISGLDHERSHHLALVAELADELRQNRLFGQPVIREQRFPKTDVVRTTVIWDKWEPLTDEERVNSILQAYEEVEGRTFSEQIALAIGLTVPEAQEAGLLPVQVVTALRASDPVSAEECRKAMVDLGASILALPDRPVLRFATVAEAQQCVQQLVNRLPESEPVWVISEDPVRMIN